MSPSSSTDYSTEEEDLTQRYWIKAKIKKLSLYSRFSEVWKVRCSDNCFYAAKIYREKDHRINRVIRLSRFLFKLKHENILNYKFDITYDDKPVLVTELIDGINLQQLREQRILKDLELQIYIRQICRGLEYLHSRNPVVIHGGLRGKHVMLKDCGEKYATVKLIDLDQMHLLKKCSSNDYTEVYRSRFIYFSRRFTPPEVLQEQPYTYRPSFDIWALGCTVYEVLTGHTPYSHLPHREFAVKLDEDGPPQLNLVELQRVRNATMRNNVSDFYRCCVAIKPSERMSATQLLQHPFIR